MKYKTKPVIIEAAQWFPPGDERYDSIEFPIARPKPGGLKLGDIVCVDFPPKCYTVRTLQGLVRIDPGDWIVTRNDGERYPVKPDVFSEKYELA